MQHTECIKQEQGVKITLGYLEKFSFRDLADTLRVQIFCLAQTFNLWSWCLYITRFLWNLFPDVAIQIDKGDSCSYCKAAKRLRSHLTRWSGWELHGTFVWLKLNPWQSVNHRNVSERWKRCFLRAKRIDWEKQMRRPVKLIDRGWYNMETGR